MGQASITIATDGRFEAEVQAAFVRGEISSLRHVLDKCGSLNFWDRQSLRQRILTLEELALGSQIKTAVEVKAAPMSVLENGEIQ